MRRRKNLTIFLFVLLCILLNYIGKGLADYFVLPVWMDSFGTVLMAYVLGPVCGVMVGLTGNILYCICFDTSLLYGFTSVAIGLIVGICAKKGYMNSIFGVLSTAFAVTFFSVVVSVPINYMISNGTVGNVWGEGVSNLLQELGCNSVISCMIGQFYIDFLDKVITILLLYVVIRIVRRRRNLKRKKNKKRTANTVAILLFCAVFLPPCKVNAEIVSKDISTNDKDFDTYIQTIYNGENGLPGGMTNDIVQTEDGVLWIGTYNGLYRYNGNNFQWMNGMDSVKTVNCLYTDEAGRMWIGTNDNGLSIFINENIANVVNHENGLPSDSVRCVTESNDGYYYVGTTDCLAILKLSNGLEVCDTIPEIMYAKHICADQNGHVATVTDEGVLYLLREKEMIARKKLNLDGASYTCCSFDETGKLYVGTSSNVVEVYEVLEEGLHRTAIIECGKLEKINSLNVSDTGEIYICADNGVGYFDSEDNYHFIHTNNFDQSVEHMIVDYQGNLWFTSSRRGLLRLCPSVFKEIYSGTGVSEKVVNTVAKWKDCLYFGTDSGLDVVDKENMTQAASNLVEQFDGVRVRCIFVDSQNSMWICTSGKGITRVSKTGQMETYDSKTGALGDKFRTAIELENGTIVAAGDSGITYITDGRVSDTLGSAEGLTNPKVLSLNETKDGSILAGTDGNGIAVIRNGQIAKFLKQKQGLSSDVILRMVPDLDGNGLFIVTSNGLCYMNEEGKIRLLSNFPFYNNYDVVEGNGGKLFVLCSAGIYVVDKEELLEGKELPYELLNARKGLRIQLTPNSWNYIDENDNLYLSGSTGVMCMNLNHYNISVRSYRMLLKTIKVDGNTYFIEKGAPFTIPKGADKIEINPEVVNYSVNDPNVSIYLEGIDKEPRTMSLSNLNSVVYSNLPSGEYTFHIAILGNGNNNILAENTYQIIKEKEIYDNWWFRIYMVVVAAIFISYITWLFFRTQIQKTLRLQKMEIEQAKKQIQMGNETIITIARTVDAKDENTSQHSVRVSEYSVMIAEQLGYSEEECEKLRQTALLHDIGKIGIPDRVLNKPAKLTDEEYEIMKTHVSRGAEILKNFTLIEHVEEGVLYHHERYDGRGYIHGLKGEEIPLNARIIGIADAFDAMTANRVYRKKLDIEYVLEELRKGRGTQFDPKLVDIMLGLVETGKIDVEKLYQTSNNKMKFEQQEDNRK